VVYVTVSGVSPFLDDSLDETCSNIVRRDFCFPHEYFSGISGDAKDFISMLLVFDVGLVSGCSLFCMVPTTCTHSSSYAHFFYLTGFILRSYSKIGLGPPLQNDFG